MPLFLQTLGNLEVRAEQGAGPIHLQPKRLALLVYLAIGHAGKTLTRDTLIAFFWPDHGEKAGRSALRQSLHYLKARLGPEALTGYGSNEIGVEPIHLRCDVIDFDASLDADQPYRALKFFAGDFLEGFFYSDPSPAFHDWMDGERTRLRDRAFEAAIALAEQEEQRGNHVGEVHWLKRALELEPFREDLLRRIVGRYEQDGNLGTAAQAVRKFSRTLRMKYGVPISPATRELLRNLQQGLTEERPVPSFRGMRELQRETSKEMTRTVELLKQLQGLSGRGALRPRVAEPAPADQFGTQETSRNEEQAGGMADVSTPYDIVAIAASAGGVTALTRVVSSLPADFPVPLVIVQHLDPSHPSHLARILSRAARLKVQEAEDGQQIAPGTAYLAPPDHHLLVDPGGLLRLTQTSFVNFVRPSADLLFESVAGSCGERAIAVVLSGSGVDGATGVSAIRKMGGYVLVQDEATSEFFGMPGAAIRTGEVSRVLSLDDIGPALVGLLAREVPA